MLRYFLFYCYYLFLKIKHCKNVVFNGFTVIHGNVEFKKNIIINSSPLSNLVGLYQRTIIIARHGGHVVIGNNCGISGSTIYSMKEIIIGDNVLIGGNCKVIDNDFHPLDYRKRNPQQVEDIAKKRIIIGNGCFIGANSILLKGTELGENCIIGAGSVVCGKFPDNVIIAGNPAKIVKEQISK